MHTCFAVRMQFCLFIYLFICTSVSSFGCGGFSYQDSTRFACGMSWVLVCLCCWAKCLCVRLGRLMSSSVLFSLFAKADKQWGQRSECIQELHSAAHDFNQYHNCSEIMPAITYGQVESTTHTIKTTTLKILTLQHR